MTDTNDTQAELAAWELLAEARRERDEAREDLKFKEKLVAELTKQRDHFSKKLGEVREVMCDAMINENTPTLIMVQKLVDDHTDIIFAVRALKLARGRFHTEQAANHLFKLIP